MSKFSYVYFFVIHNLINIFKTQFTSPLAHAKQWQPLFLKQPWTKIQQLVSITLFFCNKRQQIVIENYCVLYCLNQNYLLYFNKIFYTFIWVYVQKFKFKTTKTLYNSKIIINLEQLYYKLRNYTDSTKAFSTILENKQIKRKWQYITSIISIFS